MAKYHGLALTLVAVLITLAEPSSASGGSDDAANLKACNSLNALWTKTWGPVLQACGVKENHFTCSAKGHAAVKLVLTDDLKAYIGSPDASKATFFAAWKNLCGLFLKAQDKDLHAEVDYKTGVITLKCVPGNAVPGAGPDDACEMWNEIQLAWAVTLKGCGFPAFHKKCAKENKQATMVIECDPKRNFPLEKLKGLWLATFKGICDFVVPEKNIEVGASVKGNIIQVVGEQPNKV